MVLITSRAMMTDSLFQPGESSIFDDDDLDKDKLGDGQIEGRGAICTGYWERQVVREISLPS